MTDHSNDTDVSRARGSVKEAIGKIMGDSSTVNAGAAQKNAADAQSSGPIRHQTTTGDKIMPDTDHDISVLNDLIATTLDSADGYTEAAKEADNGRFGAMFTARAAERRQVATSLQGVVATLGGEPEDDGTILAKAHRMFTGLRNSISGGDTVVVDEVERGEDHIKAKFEDAMKDAELSQPTRSAIEQAYGSVRAGHDQMRDLKHSLHGSN